MVGGGEGGFGLCKINCIHRLGLKGGGAEDRNDAGLLEIHLRNRRCKRTEMQVTGNNN